MRKRYLILFVVGALALVGCNRKIIQETTVLESSSQEQSTDVFASDSDKKEETTVIKENVDSSSYIPNGKTSQLMIDVLLNGAEFTFVQLDDFSVETISTMTRTISNFDFRLGEFQNEPVEFGEYRVVDMNGDGCNEVIVDVSSIEALILYIDDGEVYGIIYPWKGVKRIFKSGIAEGATGGSHLTYYIIDFDKASYSKVIVAEEDYGEYYVEGKQVELEEYLEYMNNGKFEDIVPYWEDFELILSTK